VVGFGVRDATGHADGEQHNGRRNREPMPKPARSLELGVRTHTDILPGRGARGAEHVSERVFPPGLWESSPVNTVRDWLSLLEGWYPLGWAEEWDNPGLQVGDPGAGVERAMLALDPTVEVLREAHERSESVVGARQLVFPRSQWAAIDRNPKGDDTRERTTDQDRSSSLHS
jgi:hypothetical protein